MPKAQTIASLASTPCIDADIYASFVDLMPRSTVDQQLEALLNDPSQDIDSLADALQAGRYGQAVQLAHHLKGTCLLIGLSAMAAVLAQLEAACGNSMAGAKARTSKPMPEPMPEHAPEVPPQLAQLLAQLHRERLHTRAALPPSSGEPTLAR
jgi:HPt (histidine-containing phosphotransfer) domain-containing protein